MSKELSREELRERLEILIPRGTQVDEDGNEYTNDVIWQLIDTYTAQREQAAELRGRIDETEACLRMCTPDRGVHSNEWLTDFFNIRLATLQATKPEKGTEE